MSDIRIDTLAPGHFQVQGDLIFATANQACRLSKQLFQGEGDVLIDVGQVAHVDSAGLACLLGWMREGKSRERDVIFENLQHQMRSLIRVSGLEKLIKVAA